MSPPGQSYCHSYTMYPQPLVARQLASSIRFVLAGRYSSRDI